MVVHNHSKSPAFDELRLQKWNLNHIQKRNPKPKTKNLHQEMISTPRKNSNLKNKENINIKLKFELKINSIFNLLLVVCGFCRQWWQHRFLCPRLQKPKRLPKDSKGQRSTKRVQLQKLDAETTKERWRRQPVLKAAGSQKHHESSKRPYPIVNKIRNFSGGVCDRTNLYKKLMKSGRDLGPAPGD